MELHEESTDFATVVGRTVGSNRIRISTIDGDGTPTEVRGALKSRDIA